MMTEGDGNEKSTDSKREARGRENIDTIRINIVKGVSRTEKEPRNSISADNQIPNRR
jgi:hypothetical protein